MAEDEVLGALARVVAQLPGGGELRPGQQAMASAVASALADKRHVVVQAGTGTGKSVAYLVPAILSGARVVIATATKALQDQLAGKDLPFLASHLGVPFEFAVLKGRSNYLCVQKAAELGQTTEGQTSLELDDLDSSLRSELVDLLSWAKTSSTGDRAELPAEPSSRAWSSVSVGAEECPGAARCPMGEQCFAEGARRAADAADVVVVNTHLYGVHLASGGFVLSDHDVVVLDEVHEVEDVAANTLGFELSAGRFRGLARAVRGIVAESADAVRLEEIGLQLDSAIAPHRGARLTVGDLSALGPALSTAAERVTTTLATLRKLEPPPGTKAASRKERAMKSATGLGEDLALLAGELSDNQVVWVEGPAHAPVLKVAAIDVGGVLARTLWSERTAVLTSATIPPGLPARLGMTSDSYEQLDVGSPFDYPSQALLYVPRHLPDPRSPAYENAMLAELERLIRAAGGRTLALFTSWRVMTAAASALAPILPWRVLTQAELPKPALLREFSSDETSCLFATMGFWQGVDVPGPALSLVVLDKIPFPRPDEPLVQARRDKAGAGAFAVVDLPRAATLLAQGAGRLIRSTVDRGVVAVLDPRLATKDYRRALLGPVPPMKRTVTFADVETFLAEGLRPAAPP